MNCITSPEAKRLAMARSASPTTPSTGLPDARLLWGALVESVDCYVAVIDADRRLLFLNRCTEGYDSVQSVLGSDLLDYIPQDCQEMVRQRIEQVFNEGRTIQYEVAGRDKAGVEACYVVHVSPVLDSGRVVAAVMTGHDMRRLSGMEASFLAERSVLQKLIKTQERERQLVSYEIHDGLAQYLASAIMQLESCSEAVAGIDLAASASGTRRTRQPARPSKSLGRDFEEGMRLVRAALVEARRLINGLRPPMLDELGILDAIDSLVSDARIEVPEVVLQRPASLPRLPADFETAVFRIVQEGLSNIRKHADAHRVTVTLEMVDHLPQATGDRAHPKLRVAIADDGRGFDPSNVSQQCFGLEGIRQRARLFGSEVTIRSRYGGNASGDGDFLGTLVEVVLPVPER